LNFQYLNNETIGQAAAFAADLPLCYLAQVAKRSFESWYSPISALGPSTRLRFSVRIAVRFRARFAYKGFWVLIDYLTPIITLSQHISGKIAVQWTFRGIRHVQMHVRTGVRIRIRFPAPIRFVAYFKLDTI
jgi:hypothetical protein